MEFYVLYKDKNRIILKNQTGKIEDPNDLYISVSPMKIRLTSWFPEEYETELETDYDGWYFAFQQHKEFFNWLKGKFSSYKKTIVKWYNEKYHPVKKVRYDFYRRKFKAGKEEYDKFCKELIKDEEAIKLYENMKYDEKKEIEDFDRI